jgi:hypothetical protein
MRNYDYKRLVADIRRTPTRRKYRNAFIALAKVLQPDYVPIKHGGNAGGDCPGDKGSTLLYWDVGLHYCDIEVNASGKTYSVFIKQCKHPQFVHSEKEWFFESVTLEEFSEDWLTRLLVPFRKKEDE